MSELGYPRPPTQQNPLATLSGLMQLQAAQNQNQLFQQEFADRAAANRAYQQAIDPSTGQIDYARLSQALAGGGFGRLLPEVMRNQQESQKRAIELEGAQFDLMKKKTDATYGALSSLMQKPNPTRKDVLDAASRLVAQGTHKVSELMPILQQLPAEGPELKDALNQIFLQTLDSRERLARITPNIQMVQLGGTTKAVDTNPLTNPAISGQEFKQTLTPGDLAGTVQGQIGNVPVVTTKENFLRGGGLMQTGPALSGSGLTPAEATQPTSVLIRNPDGSFSPANVTREQFNRMSGQGPVATAAPLTPSGLTPEAANQIVDYYDPETRTVRQTTRQAAIDSIMRGNLPKGPALGAPEAAGVEGRQSAEALGSLRESAGTAPQRIFQLEQAAHALSNPKVETGPGSETVNTIKAFMQNYGGKYLTDPEAIKDYESARKYLTQYAIGQAGSLGQGTDSKLAAAFTGNPNTSMTKLAAQDLIKSAVGLERMQQAIALSWEGSGQPPESFNKWRVGFVKDLDPRVFVFDKLPEDKRQSLIADVAKMSKPEQEKFAKSYNLAVNAGIIPNIFGGAQ